MTATLRTSELPLRQGAVASDLRAELLAVLEGFELPIEARALVRSAISRARKSQGSDRVEVGEELEQVVRILLPPRMREEIAAALQEAGFGRAAQVSAPASDELVAPIGPNAEPSASRALAREACLNAGLSRITMQRVINAVGELARNISTHAGTGRIRFVTAPDSARLVIIAEDEGPGISQLEAVLAGTYRSRHGRARGLASVRRHASEFEITTSSAGTRVEIAFGR